MIGRIFSRGARVAASLLAFGFVLPLSASTLDPSGDLDPSFSGDGKASFNFATVQVPADSRAVIAQASGKVVVGGGSNNGLFKDYVLVRLNTDGTTDGSFGNGGIVTTDMGFDDHINAMAQNSTGARFCGGGISSVVFGVACYTVNGALDTSFTGDGIDESNPPGATAGRIQGMTFDRSDKLIVVGWADFSTGRDWVIRRYNTDGSGDSSFGAGGWQILDVGGSDRAFDVGIIKGATIAQDRIVVVGTNQSNGVIAIFNSNGTLDTTNGLTGATGKFIATTHPAGMTIFEGLAIDSSNNIFVTGQPNGFHVAKYSLSGTSFTTSADLGGTTNDVGFRVKVDASNNVFASGTSNSGTDFSVAKLTNALGTTYNTHTDMGGSNDFAQDLTVDANGFLTAVGGGGGGINFIIVARYKPDGTLDTTFSGDGEYQAFITGGSSDTSTALAVQADGKIVMTGSTLNSSGDYDLAVARANADGSFDTTFASSGWDVRGFSTGSSDAGVGVAMDTSAASPNDNRIVVVGSSSSAAAQNFVVLRYLKTGALDTSFSGDGIASGTWGTNSEAKAVAVQSNGKIVVGGDIAGNAGSFALARLNTDGTLDTSFSGDGLQTIDIGTADVLKSIAIDPSGNIVAAGQCVVGGVFKMCLTRVLGSNGAIDTTFGANGKVIVNNLPFDDNNDDSFDARSLQLLPNLDTPSATDYKIVVGGQVVVQTTSGSPPVVKTKANWLLARFNLDGSLDTSFNGTGIKELDPVAAGYVGAVNSVALQHDEKIVAFGESSQPDAANPGFFLNRQITVGRFNWDGSVDTTYGDGGWRRATIGSDPGEAMTGYVYNSGALIGRALATSFIISSDFALTRYQSDPVIVGSGVPTLKDALSDTGRSSTDNITKNTTPTFVGDCSEGETVYLLVNGANTQPRTRQICPAIGTYALTPTLSGVPRTTYSITTQTQSGVGDSAVSSALSVTVDAEINPVVAIVSPVSGSNQLPNPTISGTSAESTADIVITSTGSGTGCASFQAAADGTWSCTSGLLQGPQTISVVQTDVAGNVATPITRSFSVKAATATSVVSSANPSTFGQALTFTATVVPTGAHNLSVAGTTVRFVVDGSQVSAPTLDVNGQATYSPTSLVVGTHTVQAFYDENANWLGSSGSLAPDQLVQKADTTTSVTSSSNPSTFGQSVTFTATIAVVAPGAGSPSGTVTFLDGGGAIGSGTLSGGVAAFSTGALAVGNHTITASYVGDGNFNASAGALPSAQVVNKANTSTAVTSSQNPSTLNQSVTLTATISAAAPGAGTPSGTVTFLDGGNPIGSGTLSGGVATFSTTSLTVGNHTITAAYAGDTNFNGSSGSLAGNPQVVKKTPTTTVLTSSLNPSKFGQSVTFTATVAPVPPGTGTPTGVVTFLDGGTSFGTSTLDGSGVATLTSSTLATGNHTITASYGSDATFDVSTGALTGNPQVVNKADTTTALSSSANPSVFGQSVTFTATITATAPGAGTPTGTVTFLDGGTSIGTGTLNAGVATLTTSTLAVSSHAITTTYTGDANFNGSSGSLTGNPQVVNKAATTTTLTSSQNPSLPNQSVTFTATVNAAAPGAGTPTGTVTFLDGGNVIGTGTLSAGVATFATSTLTPGSHTITSSYSGDANFASGTGSLTGNPQVVSKIGTSTTINSITPPGPITLGSSVVVSASVAAVPPGSGTPSGTVTVTSTDAATSASDTCTFTLSAATSCTLTPTSVGSKAITATYGGDDTFSTSTSSATALSVTPPTRTITATAGSNGAITPSSQYVPDGNTASFTVTPSDGYSAVMSTTCPEGLGTLSNNVYTTRPISADCTVTASFAPASTSLTLTVTDNHEFARYGNLANFVVTVTNNSGSDVTGLTIAGSDTSADFDNTGGRWMCFGSATQCAPAGNGPFNDSNVSVAANGSVTWLVTVPVRGDAPDDAVSYTVTLSGAGSDVVETDTDILTLFRDGFDVAYSDGSRPASTISENWDGKTSLSFSPLVNPDVIIESVLSASTSDNSGFRIEQLNGAQHVWLRAVATDARGNERASAWAAAEPHALLTLGIVEQQSKYLLMLIGAEDEIDMAIGTAGSWRVQTTKRD